MYGVWRTRRAQTCCKSTTLKDKSRDLPQRTYANGSANKNQILLENWQLRIVPRNGNPGPTCSEHAPDVGVALVEPLLHDGVDKGGAVEESPLVRLTVILLRHLPPAAKWQSHI